MKDQPNNWEADWREELAGYEAPLQPGDWAGMQSLLDGGAPAPSEGPAMSAAKATNAATVIKSTLITLLVIAVAGVGYWLATNNQATEVTAELPPEVTEIPAVLLDTLPPGYRYDIKTYKQLDRKGKVLSVKYDTSIVPVRYRIDTVYYSDGKGNLRMKVDTAIGPPASKRTNLTRARPSHSGGGTSLTEMPPVLPDLAPPPAIAPAAAPPAPAKMADPKNGNEVKSPPYAPTPATLKPSRERVVPRLSFSLVPELPGHANYYQLRLRQIVRDHPVEVVPAKTYNGYFPSYRNDF